MSPERAACAIERYLKALCKQVEIAEAFYNGQIEEGVEGLLTLPEEIRLKIDQLIWEASGGQAIDPTEEASSELISKAILFSLEERMGMHAS